MLKYSALGGGGFVYAHKTTSRQEGMYLIIWVSVQYRELLHEWAWEPKENVSNTEILHGYAVS